MQGIPRTKQQNCFLRGAPEISRINDFNTYTLGNEWQIKIKDLIYRVLDERSNITASFGVPKISR